MNNEWKMVPVEPTKEQTLAVCMHPDLARALYSSMLAAAPVPPAGDVEVPERMTPKLCTVGDKDAWNHKEVHGWNSCHDKFLPIVTRLTAERDGLLAKVEQLENLPHGKILAEAAGRHLLNSGAENFVGDVFTIEADDGTTKFEIVVTTQKVGAKSPGEVCSELQSELTMARELLGGMLFAFDDGVGRDWSAPLLGEARKFCPAVEFKSAPAAKGGE